ncbi:MAG: hypothetical protein V4689_12280 [Verrucomicrobiota bacterium]
MTPSPPPPSPAIVDADHPWLGLASFTEETQRFFFGRDAEIAEIFVRVRDNLLTVLYGQSGLGKSSLLGAGLLPKLRVEHFRPVQIRLRYHEGAPPLIDQVFAHLDEALLLGQARPATLWEWLHHRETRPADLDTHPPVLVFDQFEEIFTLGQRAERLSETQTLITQIAELIENRTPAALRARFQEDRRLSRDYDNAASSARLVITLREDFLSHLEQWKKTLPSLMKNRMALEMLNGAQALEAVVRPGRLEGRNLIDEEVGAAIVRFVAKREADAPLVEIGAVPPLLSLLCEQLNAARLEARAAMIDAAMVRDRSGDILQRFYEESFSEFPTEHREIIRALVEDPPMITEGGYRNSLVREDAEALLTRAGLTDPASVFDILIRRRLITQDAQVGLQRLEITHDVLVPLLLRSRKERRDRITKEETERKLADEAAKARKRRLLFSAMLLLTLVAVAGGFFGILQASAARKSEAMALESQRKAIGSAKIAEQETGKTKSALAEAETERAKAVDLAEKAERLAAAAKKSEKEAKENLVLAQNETEKARKLQQNLEHAVLEFIPYRFAAVLSDNNVERQSEMWADKVDYLTFGINTRSQITASLKRDLTRWPTRQFLVMTKPAIEKLENGYQLEFPLNYTLLDKNRNPSTGELMVTIRIDPGTKVFSYKSEVLRAKK